MPERQATWDQLKDHFQTMLDLDPASWEDYLLREDLPAETASSLRDLLHAHTEAGSFLNTGALFGAATSEADATLTLLPDTLLAGRFRILRFLARGGMGTVYEARDTELAMTVAIKTIRPEIALYPGVLQRFKREVHLAMQVTHPNVCRVYDHFRHTAPDTGELVFLSMEMLHGITLAEHLRRHGPMSGAEVAAIVRQLLSGLAVAHQAGVLHRDLKPENIFLEESRDGHMRAVITDFGMALEAHTAKGISFVGTTQFLLGTPEYMSPEQVEGHPLTPASDLYSLGLVVYQMLTGIRAFAADSSLHSVLRRLREPPPAPSLAVKQIDPRWDVIVTRCLQREPARRYSSAQDLDLALSQLLVEQGSFSPRARLTRFPRSMKQVFRHHPRNSIATALALLVAVAGLATFLHRQPNVHPESLSIVLADLVNTTGEATFDNALNVAIAADLQQTPFLILVPNARIEEQLRYMGEPAHTRLTQTIARQVCQRTGAQVLIQPSLALSANGYVVGINANDCATGRLVATHQVEVASQKSILDALDKALDDTRASLGEASDSLRRFDVPLSDVTTGSLEALAEFSEGGNWSNPGPVALAHYLKATEIDPNFALAYARQGTIYGNMGEFARSAEALRKAYDRRDRVTEWERFYIVSHYYGFVTGEIPKEMQTYEEWARIYPHDMAWAMNLSVDYAFTGQFDRAIDLCRRALREGSGNAPGYVNLAQLYLATDHPDEAQLVLDQAAQLRLDDWNLQLDAWDLAFYRGDDAARQRIVAEAVRYPGAEDALAAREAAASDRLGKLADGLAHARRAAQVAERSNNIETAAAWLVAESVRQAESGAPASARDLLRNIAELTHRDHSGGAADGRDEEMLDALVAGQLRNADALQHSVTQLNSAYPLDTLVQSYWLPIARAWLLHVNGHDTPALAQLALAQPYDLGIASPGQCMDATYLRGLILLTLHQSAQASAQFQSIVAHRGFVLACPTSSLAQLGLARAYAQQGDSAAARHAYQDLLVLWNNADSDFLPKRKATVEYSALR